MKKIFLSGVAVIVPVALTLWVLFAFFGSIDNFVNFYLDLWFDYSFTGLGFLLALVTIMVTGAVTRTRIGGWFYKLANAIIYKFPVVNQIYKLFKETFDVATSKQSFKTVVKVEFPKAGVYSIGFLTNENTIFIPTTPNPTSGFLIQTNKYEILDMNVEEAIKYVVSIGTVIPNSKQKSNKTTKKGEKINMVKLVLIRHGESQWNLENRFTGWTDVELSKNGMNEAVNAGRKIKEAGLKFDVAYTSVLKRANDTLNLVMLEAHQKNVPTKFSWKLNERHYGALQGLNKEETATKYGADQVKLWRRSIDVRPPELSKDNPSHPRFDPKYKNLSPKELPAGENLLDTIKRVVEYWDSDIAKDIKARKKVIIAAHGNSLRALVKYLDNISNDDIMAVEIPTGKPLVYEIDELTLKPIKHYYL